MKQRQRPIVLTSILLGGLFDIFFYDQLPGINVLFVTTAALVATFLLAKRFHHPITREAYGVAASAIFFAGMIAVRTGPFLVFMDVCLTIYLLMLLAKLLILKHQRLGDFGAQNYIWLLNVPFSALAALADFASKLSFERSKSKHNLAPILRGVLISLPILAIFLALFSAADPIFNKYLSRIFRFHLSPQLIVHSVIIAFASCLFIGVFALFFTTSDEAPNRSLHNLKVLPLLGALESYIVLGSVAVLFLLFIIVQVRYLFGGAGQILASNLTYAEYARKGFFELLAVAFISLALIWMIKSRTLHRKLEDRVIFNWLSGFLIIEVMVVMASALKRLALYESTYGFTESRLYGHLFIGWLAVAFGLLFIHIIRDQKATQFAFRIFASILVFFGLINLMNPEGMIARQNLQRFASTGKIDAYYFSHLSEDATSTIAGQLNNPKKEVSEQAALILAAQSRGRNDAHRSWRSFNLGRQSAQHVFETHKEQLQKYPDVLPE